MNNSETSQKKPLKIEDLFKINGVSGPAVSPDGKYVAGVVTRTDLSLNSTKDEVVLLSADGSRQIVAEGSAPAFSPEGKYLAYEASEKDLDGIWIYELSKKQKRFLAPVVRSEYFMGHLSDKGFSWSPDGKHVAYLSAVAAGGNDPKADHVRVINRLLYKTKGGRIRAPYTDHDLTHIWIVPVLGGEPEIITEGPFNEHSIAWSPDSLQLTFISNRSSDPDNNHLNDLWTVNIKTKEVTRLTDDPGTAFCPAWSPDGKHIAYLATTNRRTTKDSPAADTQAYLIPAGGGPFRCLTKSLDRRVENISWHPDSAHLYFTAGNEGTTPLYRVSIQSNRIETVIAGHFKVLEYALAANGEDIGYVKTDVTHPPEIFLHKGGNRSSRLTRENDSLCNEYLLRDAEMIRFPGFDQTPIQGWLMKPARFDPQAKHPMILYIHGGPHNMFGYEFEPQAQMLAAQGYAVLYINPRGSHGYGQAFSNGCVMNWGGGDYNDLMTGVDYVIDRFGWVDRERLGVTGQSYGGYMTNWIITQTNRFKAAVSDGGISNLISFTGTSLYHLLMESEFQGKPWDNYPLLWQWSPLRNIKNVTTPTLFLHGETDNEVPVTQAEEMYTGLKKLGVETTFIQYLGEGHGWRPDLAPKNRADVYGRMTNWFNRYLQ